jgi:hypothetical protein
VDGAIGFGARNDPDARGRTTASWQRMNSRPADDAASDRLQMAKL